MDKETRVVLRLMLEYIERAICPCDYRNGHPDGSVSIICPVHSPSQLYRGVQRMNENIKKLLAYRGGE